MKTLDLLNDYYEKRIQWVAQISSAEIRDFMNETCGLYDDGERVLLKVKTKAGNYAKYNILQDIMFCIKQYDLVEKDFINCVKSTIPGHIRIMQQTYGSYNQANYWINYKDMRDWIKTALALYYKKKGTRK